MTLKQLFARYDGLKVLFREAQGVDRTLARALLLVVGVTLATRKANEVPGSSRSLAQLPHQLGRDGGDRDAEPVIDRSIGSKKTLLPRPLQVRLEEGEQ